MNTDDGHVDIAQIAQLADSSQAALSAFLANIGAPVPTSNEINQLEDDSIPNKYNPIR